ncbi:hypothetical protein [Enhygromyxa salina]|nr:hypothetical protein [Enhygromyxa salina]
MKTIGAIVLAIVLSGCDPEPPVEQSPPADPSGEHGAHGLGPSAPANGPILLFEDDRDREIMQPEPKPVLTLQQVSDRGREALAAEGVLENPMSRDAEVIAGVRARWFFTGQGVTVQNNGSNLVRLSVDFIGDDCHTSVAYRDVEAGKSLAVEPVRPVCDAELAQMTIFNELGYPIHIAEISAADRREVAN